MAQINPCRWAVRVLGAMALTVVVAGCSFGVISGLDSGSGREVAVHVAYPLGLSSSVNLLDSDEAARFLTRTSDRIVIQLIDAGQMYEERIVTLQFDNSINAVSGTAVFEDVPYASYEILAEAYSSSNVLQAHATGMAVVSDRDPVEISLLLMPHDSLVLHIPMGFHFPALYFMNEFVPDEASSSLFRLQPHSAIHIQTIVSAHDQEIIRDNPFLVFAGDWSDTTNPFSYALRSGTGNLVPTAHTDLTDQQQDEGSDMYLTFVGTDTAITAGTYYLTLYNNDTKSNELIVASGYSGQLDIDGGLVQPFKYFSDLQVEFVDGTAQFSASYNGRTDVEFYLGMSGYDLETTEEFVRLVGAKNEPIFSVAKSEIENISDITWIIMAVFNGLENGSVHHSEIQWLEVAELTVTISLDNPAEADISFSNAQAVLSASATVYQSQMTIMVISADTIDSFTWLLNGDNVHPALTLSGDPSEVTVDASGLSLAVHSLSLFVEIGGDIYSAQFDFSVVE